MLIARLTADDIPLVLETSIECRLCLWSADAYRSELTRNDSIMLKAETSSGAFAGFAVGRTFDMGAKGRSVELTNIGVRRRYSNRWQTQRVASRGCDRQSPAEVGSFYEVVHSL